ncbi:MAG: hypothetical protein QXD55_01510 [Candidatus Aenigmatarchaeota archaeon]
MSDPRRKEMLKWSKNGFHPDLMSDEEKRRFTENIRGLQIQFQQKYCPSCVNYHINKNDFKEKGHPLNHNDCKWHYTDILGECWNYRKRET